MDILGHLRAGCGSMNTIESRALEVLFQHQLDTGYIYFVDGDPVTNPRQLIQAIETNRKIISVNPTEVENKI